MHDLLQRPMPVRGRRRLARSSADPAVLDHCVLEQLLGELGDQEGLNQFLTMFLRLLPERLQELAEITRHGQRRPSDVAANLIATSRMIGAHRFAQQLDQLPNARASRWSVTERERFLEATRAEAGRLRRALTHYLEGSVAPRQRRGDGERGAAAVEFALISSLFFVLLFGMIQYGLWFNDSLNTRQGVRQAAREAVVENFPACDSQSSSSARLACDAKKQIGALTGPAYVKVTAPQGWATGNPLIVCAMVRSDGGTGLLPMPNGGWITAQTQMSIEQQAMFSGWADRAEVLPSGVDWNWCVRS